MRLVGSWRGCSRRRRRRVAKPKPSFINNLGAFAVALGYENAPVAFDFAKLPWESDEHRDTFIRLIRE